jgi:hypothetical protein
MPVPARLSPPLRRAVTAALVAVAAAPAQAADGLSLWHDNLPAPRWVIGASPVLGGPQAPWAGAATAVGVTGDYYFDAGEPAREGLAPSGLRASAGVWLGRRAGGGLSVPALQGATAAGDGGPESAAVLPYLGLGYTLLGDSGWGLRADLGLLARGTPSGVRLGRALESPQALDDLVRSLRLLPVLQFGVSYSF